MITKAFFITPTFEAGVAVGKLSLFLAKTRLGRVSVSEGDALVSITAVDSQVMAYAENLLAAYV